MAQRTHVALFASITLALAAGGAGVMAGLARDVAPAVKPYVQWAGHESKITERAFVIARTDDEWAELWSRHTGTPVSWGAMGRHSAPKIDFDRCLVVGYFNGRATNTDGQVAQSITTADDGVHVRFETASFQTASFGPGPDTGEATTSFGLWVIDKTDKPIIIEQAHIAGKGGATTWKVVQTFAGK